MEATGKTSNLARDQRNILKEIDGKVSVSELSEKFAKMGESKLLEALTSMEREGYVREFVAKQDEGPRTPVGRGPASQSLGDGSDLDFTAFTPAKPNAKANEEARLQAQAHEIARQAQATRAREEVAAKARAEMAARGKAEADLKARQAATAKPAAPASAPFAGILGAGPDAQARAQADAQARAQSEALERARRDAEEKARRDAEEKARREAEARAKAEIDAAIKREADERALKEIQERTRREAEERARREAEARAKFEAEQRVKREAEERARRELEERTRREVEERLRREEAERRRREDEERARRETELQARIEAETRARVDAEVRAKREAEERARRESERQARIEAETRARVDAEVRAKREAEERVRREEEEHRQQQARKGAEEEARKRREKEETEALQRSLREEQEKAQREAEETAARGEAEHGETEHGKTERGEAERGEAERVEPEDRSREEEEEAQQQREDEEKAQAKAAAKLRKAERARERAGEEAWRGDEDAGRDANAASLSAREVWEKRKPANLAKTLAVMLLVILAVGIAVLPFVPLETTPYEKSAQAWLDQPVKIGSVTLSLLPLPQLKFEKVVIGRNPQLRVAVVRASPELATLLEDRITLRSLDLDNVTVPREFLAVLLQDKGTRKGLGIRRITAKGLKIDPPELGLPPLELDASISPDGALKSASFSSSASQLSVTVEPRGGKAAIDISAGTLPLPIGIDLGLTDFTGKGTATASELLLATTEGRAFGGRLFGNVRLRWTSGWSLDGEISARQMDAVKIAGPLLGTGTLQGKGTFSMKGLLPERMVLNSQAQGNFTVQKGSISNVDMTRLLQGSGSGGGTTLFSELSGTFSADTSRLAVRNLKLAVGLLSGAGEIDMDSQKNLSGRMQIELRAQSVQARSTLSVTGTLTNPQFRRTN